MDLSQDSDFDHASRLVRHAPSLFEKLGFLLRSYLGFSNTQIASLSTRMTRKLHAYVRMHLHKTSQEILAYTMAGLESLERRTRSRIDAISMRYNDQLKQLQDQLHDLREEICQLVKKEGAKEDFHMAQILKEVRELNKRIHEVFSKDFAVGFPKNLLDEEVAESCSQTQNKGKVLKHDPAKTRQIGSRKYLEDCPEVACGPSAHVKDSVLSIQLPIIGACCQMSNLSRKQNCAGVVDPTAAVIAIDTQDWAVNTKSSSNKLIAQAVDRDIVCALDAEDKAYALNCTQCPKERILHEELLSPHDWEQAKYNVEDNKSMKSHLLNHLNPVAKGVATEHLDFKGCALRAFSFMANHARSQATCGKSESNNMKELQCKGGFVISKRRISRELKISSKSQQICTGKLVSSKVTGRKPRFLPIKERRSLRCQFTSGDIELLVTAIEKLGTGRWRDIKETYFSLGRHHSAANLKDKWRSLLHSAKLPPAKRRSVKLSSMLVKRILGIDEREKLAHHKGPVARYP